MKYTQKIKDAIHFSIKTHEIHQKQKRKGKDVAYITHPLTVGLILARVGATEDLIAAGLLHDTIEDSHPAMKVTPEKLRKWFGKGVARLVESVTESDVKQSWQDRKKEMHERIKA